jgi:hypothetical protein
MLVRQIAEPKLAQLAYLTGCSGARAAAAVALLARLGFKAVNVNDNFANYRRAAANISTP